MNLRVQVAVAGAGPAGAAAAATLASGGAMVVLLDREKPRGPNIGECLNPRVRPLLERLNLWDEFLSAGHLPASGIRSAWGSASVSDSNFLFSPYGAGWHVDRERFDGMLLRHASERGAKHLVCDGLREIERAPSGEWRVTAQTAAGPVCVEAEFLIDATGRASALARRLGVRRLAADRLTGMAGYYAAPAEESQLEAVLLVEAACDGWWYSAPLPDGRLVSVWMTDAGQARAEAWEDSLSRTIETRRRVTAHGGSLEFRKTATAESSFLVQAAGPGWAAAGDAAAAHDPLSAQGLTAALALGFEAAAVAWGWLGGEHGDAARSYVSKVRRDYSRYLVDRARYYAMEQRWPESEFWRSRVPANSATTRFVA